MSSYLFTIGSIRSDNIINNVYDRRSVLDKYRIQDDRRVVLFAPTYSRDGGTLERCFERIVEELSDEFILIIRPHYHDMHLFKEHGRFLRSNNKINVRYIESFDIDIVELFCISDVLIGDRSSVSYDFAFTGKPVITIECPQGKLCNPSIEVPDRFNLDNYCTHMHCEKTDFHSVVTDTLKTGKFSRGIQELADNSFYFNDGHALDISAVASNLP